jgi:tricorn protease
MESQLAFTAQYDGNTEVYQMPAEGGAPVRLTYSATLGRDDLADRMGPNNIVMTWRNTTPEVVFRSRWRSFNPFIGELYSVGLDAEVPAQLPVPRGGFVSFSPTTTASPTTGSSASSAPGKTTGAAWPTTSGSST